MNRNHQWRKTDVPAKQECVVCKAVRYGQPHGWGKAIVPGTGEPAGRYCGGNQHHRIVEEVNQ